MAVNISALDRRLPARVSSRRGGERKRLLHDEGRADLEAQWQARIQAIAKSLASRDNPKDEGKSALARLIGAGSNRVGEWCNGKRTPSLREFVLIATATGVSLDWLLLPGPRRSPRPVLRGEAALQEALLDVALEAAADDGVHEVRRHWPSDNAEYAAQVAAQKTLGRRALVQRYVEEFKRTYLHVANYEVWDVAKHVARKSASGGRT